MSPQSENDAMMRSAAEWIDLPLVFVDVETTGVAPALNEIIEVGAIRIDPGAPVSEFQSLVRPAAEVSPFVLRLTGIAAGDLKSAPDFGEIVIALREFIGDAVFVAHHADFDFDILNHYFRRFGQAQMTNDVVDTRDLALMCFSHLKAHRLSELSSEFKISGKFHRALDDCRHLFHVFEVMLANMRTWHPFIRQFARKAIPSANKGLHRMMLAIFQPSILDVPVGFRDLLEMTSPRIGSRDINLTDPGNLSVHPVSEWFSPNGRLATVFPKCEYRAGQSKMAEIVEERLEMGGVSVIEAGTGTGKSLAYLIPAIQHAAQSGDPVVVSTHTRHLQDQLYHSEIARLRIVWPQLRCCVIKGKENYVDLMRLDGVVQRSLQDYQSAIEIIGVLTWICRTQTGDLSELHASIRSKLGSHLGFQNWDSWKSPHYRQSCFVNSLRKRAKSAHVILANHALVLSQLTGENRILPKYSTLIMDEAHHVEDAVTNSFQIEIGAWLFHDLATKLNKTPVFSPVVTELLEYVDTLFSTIIELVASNSDQSTIVFTPEHFSSPLWMNIAALSQVIRERLGLILSRLDDEKLNSVDGNIESVQFEIERLLDKWTLFFALDPGNIHWCVAKWHFEKKIRLFMAPISVASIVRNELIDKKRAVILTSATLAIGGSFSFICNRLGVSDADCTQIASDYTYSAQAKWIAPSGDSAKLAQTIGRIVRDLGGYSMVLMTAYNSVHHLKKMLSEELHGSKLEILAQINNQSRERILERFSKRPRNHIIVGVDSFWEGVDLPNNAVRAIIIPKLPFMVPTTPITVARCNALESIGKNGFWDYMVPLAVLKFKQGIGRLIRNRSDRGIVVILDDRLMTKSYGKKFLDELASYTPITAEWDEIGDSLVSWVHRKS